MSFFTAWAKRGKPAAEKLAHELYLARHRGALALGLVGNLMAIQKLTEDSHDGDKEVSRSAIRALGTIGDEAADEWIRCEAVEELTKIGEPAVLKEIDGLTMRNKAAEALGKIGKLAVSATAVPALTAALTDEDKWVRRTAANALTQITQHPTRSSHISRDSVPSPRSRKTTENRPKMYPTMHRSTA